MSDYQVFISYSHVDADREWVRAFADSLRKHGVTVWLDEYQVQPGESLREALESGLRGSDVIVFVMTPASVKRANLFFEIGAAVGMGKRVVGIVSRDLDLSLLPQPLRTRKFLIQASPEETANELIEGIAALQGA